MSRDELSGRGRMRHYLEQLMIALLTRRVPVDEAAEFLAEVESHCLERSEGSYDCDPFEEFGDPTNYALTMGPPFRWKNLADSIGRGLLYTLTVVSVAALIAKASGVSSVSTTTAAALIVATGVYTTLSIVFTDSSTMTLTDEPKQDHTQSISARARYAVGAVVATVFGLVTAAVVIANGTTLSLGGSWLVLVALVGVVASVLTTWRAYRLRGRFVSPVEAGVTAELVNEIRTATIREGWVRYGVNGTDLRSDEWSWRKELRDAKAMVFGAAKKDG